MFVTILGEILPSMNAFHTFAIEVQDADKVYTTGDVFLPSGSSMLLASLGITRAWHTSLCGV